MLYFIFRRKANRFHALFRFINTLTSPVVITWSFREKTPFVSYSSGKPFVLKSSPREIAVGPSEVVWRTIIFEAAASSYTTLDYQLLRRLIQLTAVDQRSQNQLLLNGLVNVAADFEPRNVAKPQEKQVVISDKGIFFAQNQNHFNIDSFKIKQFQTLFVMTFP